MVKLNVRRLKRLKILMYHWSRKADHVVVPTRVLRNNDKIKLKVNRPILESYRSSPLYRGMLAWNTLDGPVQHLPTLDNFKSKL